MDVGDVGTVFHMVQGVGEACVMEFLLILEAHAGRRCELHALVQDVDSLSDSKIQGDMAVLSVQVDDKALLLALDQLHFVFVLGDQALELAVPDFVPHILTPCANSSRTIINVKPSRFWPSGGSR